MLVAVVGILSTLKGKLVCPLPALVRLRLVGARPRHDPAGLRELGLPGHVEAQDVHRAVMRGEAPDQLLALAVGGLRQLLVGDLVRAMTLRVAVVDGGLGGA